MVIEDRESVTRVLAGEPERFEALVRKYTRLGGAIAYAILGDYQLAEDVVQESFFKAYRSLAALKDPGKFKIWFSGIVRSTALDELRRHHSRNSQSDSKARGPSVSVSQLRACETVSPDAPPLERQVAEELRDLVLETIRRLPEDDRMVVVLKYMEGLSYKEVADVMGSTVSAVESRLFRARQALRSKLMNAI